MASESSSAVLDLNDADTEDTEAASVTDEVPEGVPLLMEHGYDIAVKVDAPMKQLSTLETFVTYRVRCACARWPVPPSVRRRYNHFKVLHRRLCASHPLLAPPALPPLHSARQQLDRYSPSFVAVRTLALNAFLDRVAKHPILTHSEDFKIFLTTPDDELEKIFKSENSALNLWGLSSALYGTSNSEAKPVNGARVRDPEFTSASEYLQSLQQKLTTLCSLTSKLYKGSVAVGKEYEGMKRICDAFSTQSLGRVSAAAAGVARGAGGAARAHCAVGRPARANATLPLLAAYAAAHVDKIRLRDAIHAAHVSDSNSNETHNRLEQASEALRAELADWTPKTHRDVKLILRELADRQVAMYTQVVLGWEQALKISTETNMEDLFKTVSKTAVQNLSPSKCKGDATPSETERDFDDIDISDSEIQEIKLNDDDEAVKEMLEQEFNKNGFLVSADGVETQNEGPNIEQSNGSKITQAEINGPKISVDESVGSKNGSKLSVDESVESKNGSKLSVDESVGSKNSSKLSVDESVGSKNGSKVSVDESVGSKNGSKVSVDDSVGSKNDSKYSSASKPFSDPLQDFSEVDLSS